MAGLHRTNGIINGERPPMMSHQSNSLPSTPHLRSRAGSAQPKSPTLGRNALNISPRSSPTDQRHTMPAPRRAAGGCKYETGMAKARRRVPYSLGPEKLGPEDGMLEAHLDPVEEDKLSGDMRELYDRLLPSRESEDRRRQFIRKLERLLKERWPDQTIAVNVFGSTGNDLGTTDSDVDVCLTTEWKELEHVCSLAELLAKHGMEKVVCVSSAKVPIVKVWDPELEIACDMNVNNPIALENTQMIRAYVGLDPRVRPLAMIIKHWAKRRILNDAALGGTLSSYTWICMILNFLQTRNPPILPSLQQQPGMTSKMIGGVNVAFDHNTKAYNFLEPGNKDSIGSLMFQFFRYYGHELDFELAVMSVRLGRVSTKTEKGWNLLQDNRLCVEEPFNISRNLGNTADDTSMRGIHIELRRAFKKLSEGDLDGCCEQYIQPQEEGRSSEIFLPPATSRPVIPRAPAQTVKAQKNGAKGPRNQNGSSRGQNGAGRRTSNPQSRRGLMANYPFPMTAHELQMQQQHQQHILHDELFRQYQYLQMQEQELRMQLQLQALSQGRLAASNSYPHIAFPAHPTSENGHEDAQLPSINGNHTAMSAPLRQQRFGYTSPFLPTTMPTYGLITNPSSPLLASATPGIRRDARRTSVTRSSAAASNRAHSQPARPLQPIPMYMQTSQYAMSPTMTIGQREYGDGMMSSASSNTQEKGSSYASHEQPLSGYRQSSARRPAEYMGHYIGPSPPIPAYSRSAGMSPAPSQVGLAIENAGLSPSFFPRITSYSPAADSPPSQPISESGEDAELMRSRGLSSPLRRGLATKRQRSGPLVVNGSLLGQTDAESADLEAQEHDVPVAVSGSTSEDLAFDTPSSSDDQSHDQVVAGHNGNYARHNDLDREVTPTGSKYDSDATGVSNSNTLSKPTSTHLLNLKAATYKTGDPLSPVHEDLAPVQLPVTAYANSAHVTTTSLSPAMQRMVIPKIPTFQELQSKKNPQVLSSRTNGILSRSSAAVPLPPPSPAAVVLTQQSTWQTQGKKKRAKKTTETSTKGSIANGPVGGDIAKKPTERKGG